MKGVLIPEKRGYRTVGRRRTSQSLMQPFPSTRDGRAPCRFRLCFMTLLVLCFITRSSWSSNSSGCSEQKRNFSGSNVKDDITHRGKNFQTELIIGLIKDDTLLDDGTGWIHEVTGEIILTWHRKEQHSCVLGQPWLLTSAIRTPGRIQEGTHEGTTIWLDDGCEPRSTCG
jgi:hypothetical protein